MWIVLPGIHTPSSRSTHVQGILFFSKHFFLKPVSSTPCGRNPQKICRYFFGSIQQFFTLVGPGLSALDTVLQLLYNAATCSFTTEKTNKRANKVVVTPDDHLSDCNV